MKRLLVLLPLAALLVALPAASASAKSYRCGGLPGNLKKDGYKPSGELAHSSVVKVYKALASKGSSSYRYYGCLKPNGVVDPLVKKFKGNEVKLVAKKAAYVAFTRTVGTSDTISVVDARTARQRQGLYPPYGIEFDNDKATPQIKAAKLNEKGELVVAYNGLGDATSTESNTYIYAFDADGDEQLLDVGPASQVSGSSIAISGETVSWTHSGVKRTATIGEVSLSVVGGGNGAGKTVVTAIPTSGGLACNVVGSTVSGNCVGSFAPNTQVEVTATAPAGSTVGLSGACTGNAVPKPGDPGSVVATCQIKLTKDSTLKVTTTP